MEKENAVGRAIDEVPKDFVLKPFLKNNKSEVFAMLLTEYNEEEVEIITPIVEAAKKYAPDYDVDAIYEELQKEKDR